MCIIIDKFKQSNTLNKVNVTKIKRDGTSVLIDQEIVSEHILDVKINTIDTFRIVCTPDHLPQLVLGRLISEGIIEDIAEVEQIYICEYGNRAEVLLCNKTRADFSKKNIEIVQSCCTGNKKLNSYFDDNNSLEKVHPIKVNSNYLFKMADIFKSDSPAHKKSFGTHSCYIASMDMLSKDISPFMCEDLGRHNALDKAIGLSLLNKVNLTNSIIFTTGRVPIDMIAKVIRAKIPILATKAVPTDETIEMSKKYNLTLICSTYPDSAIVYNDPLHSLS